MPTVGPDELPQRLQESLPHFSESAGSAAELRWVGGRSPVRVRDLEDRRLGRCR